MGVGSFAASVDDAAFPAQLHQRPSPIVRHPPGHETEELTGPIGPDAPAHGPGLAYIPALDGIRALAIIATMGFHGGVFLTSGGFFGVDAFFTLSGFLITSLLLSEWQETATVRLRAFWTRRARRLLPGLVVMLLGVALYAAYLVPKGTYPSLRADGIATLFYFANWHFIAVGSNYFDQTSLVSPLSHTWSLAVEEQFYLVWPLIVLCVFKWWKSKRVLLAVCLAGSMASAVEMAVTYSPSEANRLYYGTDTRAQSLLVGASLAVVLSLWADRRRREGSAPSRQSRAAHHLGGDPAWAAQTARGRRIVLAVGLSGVVAGALLWWLLSSQSSLTYEGGFLMAALATTAVLFSVTCSQRSILAAALSVSPLRFVGRISYGMYLWHFPLFIYFNGARTGLTGYPLFAIRSAVTVAVASVSFYVVERPVRRGTFLIGWKSWLLSPAAIAGTAAALLAATSLPATAVSRATSPSAPRSSISTQPMAKVLLVGDSMAATLGNGINGEAQGFGGLRLTQGSGIDGSVGRYFGLDIVNDATPNCGLIPGTYKIQNHAPTESAPPCEPGSGDPGWPVDWSKLVAKENPLVSVFLARLDIVNHLFDGRWTHIGDPAFDAHLLSQIRLAVRVLSSGGGKVILLTTPYYSTGEQPDGQPWPEDDPSRVDRFNALLREVASENPTKVFVLDLNAIVDPGAGFQQTINDVPLRFTDGIHLTAQGDCWIAPRLLPLIRQIAVNGGPSGPSASAALVSSAERTFPDTLCQAPTKFLPIG
jgi:peptidoglycan/LPS O-acetylase OafA/YrhL